MGHPKAGGACPTGLESYKKASRTPNTLLSPKSQKAPPPMEFILDQASATGSVDTDEDVSESESNLLCDPEEHKTGRATTGFRKTGQRFLLTYSQCLEDPNDIFIKLNAKRTIVRAVGAIEAHKDGGFHIHMAIELEKKLNTKDPRFFDYSYGEGYEVWHPNWDAARSWGACVNYCRGKDKECLQQFTWNCTFDEAVQALPKIGDQIYDVCAAATSKKEFTVWCINHNVQAGYYKEIWADHTKATCLQTLDLEDVEDRTRGAVPASVNPRLEFLQLPDPYDKPVVILGPTGSGKTIWAVDRMVRRFGRCLMVNRLDQIKKLILTGPVELRHKCVVFDEIRFSGDVRSGKGRFNDTNQISVCDTEFARSLPGRYTDGVLPAGFPRLFTAAVKLPFNNLNGQIARRVHIINLYPEPLDSLWPDEMY